MSYSDFNITIPHGRTSGEIATTCPVCSPTRKKSKDKCLSVNLDKGVWKCNHCTYKGGLKKNQEIEYKKPAWRNKTELSDLVVKFFETRGISQQTLIKAKVTEGLEWMPKAQKEVPVIEFNYFRDDELINIKYRAKGKDFKLFKDAELIFYNLDAIKETTECYIVEGEMDCLAMIQAGKLNTVSVPNGANLNSNNLAYLDNCIEYFVKKEKIYLAVDNDIAGRKLKNELSERLGYDICSYVEFKDCKDANECLVKHGIQGIIESCNAVKEFPLEGVFTISDISQEIDDMYEFGLDRGVCTGIEGHELNYVKGYITTITGIPSHGKSDVLDNITLHLKMVAGWNGAFYSPENKPTQLHFSKLARKLIGKHWDGDHRMSRNEVQMVKEYLDKSFWFIKPEDGFSLDNILSHVKRLQQRYGLDFFVIDAWNKLEHKFTVTETKYVGECLDTISNFCERNNIHCFLVAHPTKLKKQKDSMLYEVPTLYDIAGSSNFFNKTDNGISVYRDFENNTTQVYIQKVKFDHWGIVGVQSYNYEIASKRYYVGTPDFSNWIIDTKKKRTWVDEALAESKSNSNDIF